MACVNSPDSVVLASSEARLNEVKLLFPEGTATTFVQVRFVCVFVFLLRV